MKNLLILMVLGSITPLSFGGGSPELKTHTLSAGGGNMSGGIYLVTTSIGQLDAGHQAAGGSYAFNDGILAKADTNRLFDDSFED